MKRLLCIVGGMNAGGAETFLMKIYREMDKNQYQIDFCVAIKGEGYYDKEIQDAGGRIFHIVPKTKSLVENFSSIYRIVKKYKYQTVLRVSQSSLSAIELIAAKMGGAKKTALRSSNTKAAEGRTAQIVHYIFIPLAKLVPDIKIAPSVNAGTFMFGKQDMNRGKVKILKNGLPLEKYEFREDIRHQMRKELGWENNTVLLHVGRFSIQKNHIFLIDVVEEYAKEHSNVILYLVGEGETQNTVKRYVKKKGLDSFIIFAGLRDDIPQLMMASDVFLFPSTYEGMPNAVIEAQATGLPCLISDRITQEVELTPFVRRIPLSIHPEKWAKTIDIQRNNIGRHKGMEILQEKGYSIKKSTLEFIRAMY